MIAPSELDPDWIFDRTGFPYLPVPAAGCAVAVLPVTKAQTEMFLADPAGPGDDWYGEVIAISPRRSWRMHGLVLPWHLLLTGIRPVEVVAMAGWLGPGYRLPTTAEWRAADLALSALALESFDRLIDRIDAGAGHPAASGILRKLRDTGCRTAAELTLLVGGALEWVSRPDGPPGGLGRPVVALAPHLINNPRGFPPIVPHDLGRDPTFGARLVSPLGRGRQ